MERQEKLKINGLDAERNLKGTVYISGAKNAALKAMAGAVLFDGPVELHNVPDTADVRTIVEIMTKLGARIESKDDVLTIDPNTITNTDIDRKLAGNIRASVMLTGPLLARYGKTTFPAPGGCVIGCRPIDLFLNGYRKLGASVVEHDELFDIKDGNFHGGDIFFDKVTVGGTETLVMTATLAKGRTILYNCAMEPEIVNLVEWLNRGGAKISGAGTPTITVDGTAGKLLKPVKYEAIPDRIEAGSYLILGALIAKELEIKDCEPEHLRAVVSILSDAGVKINVDDKAKTIVVSNDNAKNYTPLNDIRTHEYPGFPTDLQAPLTVFATQVNGKSAIFETIYENRFKYVQDLVAMGANIRAISERDVEVNGPTTFKGTSEIFPGMIIPARDIRAGFAIVMAAILAHGESTISNVHLIDRGYEDLAGKLKGLGVELERISN